MSRGTISGNGIVTDGLVLTLDAANPKSYVSGSTSWFDLASQNAGSLLNGPSYQTSNGGTILFDGIDDSCTLFNDNRIKTPTFTICSTFKTLKYDTNGTGIFTREFARLNLGVFYGGTTGSYFFVRGNNYGTTGAEINGVTKQYNFLLNTWYHLAYVVDIPGNNYKCYSNGIQIFSTGSVLGSDFASSTNDATIASRYSGTSTRSNIEVGNFSFYNRVLSDEEVLQNYNATKTRFGL
jgi:hypothetical protein